MEADGLIRICGFLSHFCLYTLFFFFDLLSGTITLSDLLLILFYSVPEEVKKLHFQNCIGVICEIAYYHLPPFLTVL